MYAWIVYLRDSYAKYEVSIAIFCFGNKIRLIAICCELSNWMDQLTNQLMDQTTKRLIELCACNKKYDSRIFSGSHNFAMILALCLKRERDRKIEREGKREKKRE